MEEPSSSATEHFNRLIQFRQAAYAQLGNGRDALFELTDAVIQMRLVQSFAELSCAPAFRRQWASAYEALQDGRPDRVELLHLYQKLVSGQERVILAGDHTAWERMWAESLAGRSYQHQPTPIPGRKPVTLGLGYSTIAVVPEAQGSWALPLLHERIGNQKPVQTAAEQLQQVCAGLPGRPVSIWDSEYGCAKFLLATDPVKADKLIRLRTNLGLEGPTKPWSGKGKKPIHGIPFKFKDPSTWWVPDQEFAFQDPQFGPVRVRIWDGLRFGQALNCKMKVALVERLQEPGTRRRPKLLWFAWIGEPPPEQWWQFYARRYPVDHWYRFAKGRLHWTLPHFSTPEQADRWSDLMPLITWELWLARAYVQDCPLPWQKPLARLSPGRVCEGFRNLLVTIGTPTRACKSRGKAPGWPKGRSRQHRTRFELVRSEQWKKIRERKRALPPSEKAKRGRPKQQTPLPAPVEAT